MLTKTPVVINGPFYDFVLWKAYYVLVLLCSIFPEFKQKVLSKLINQGLPQEKTAEIEKYGFNLENIKKIIRTANQTRFEQFINCLSNFVLEIKQFPSPEDIPLEKQQQMIKSLVPFFNTMNGQLTSEGIAKDIKNLLLGQEIIGFDIKNLLRSQKKHLNKDGDKESKDEKFEYEENIDLKNENYLFNLLELEISYISDELKVTLKLNKKKGKGVIVKEEMEEFIKSERDFALLFRLAVAAMVNEDGKRGWLNKYNKLYIKFEEDKPKRDTELGDLRKFLEECNIPFLEEIAKSKGLDAKEVKKSLIRTKEYNPARSVRLAIPTIKIEKVTIKSIKNYKCRFISPKRVIRLPKCTIVKVKDKEEKLEESEKDKLEKI